MLELIKNNQKAKMEDMRKDTKSKLDSFKRDKTESQVLYGLGNGILQDLEEDLIVPKKKDQPVEEDLNVSDPNKIGDSTMEVFTKNKSYEPEIERKAVHFAEETESHYSESRQYTDRHQQQSRPSSKSSNSEENKLSGLNNLLKNNEFKLKDDDEPDFAVFLQKLQEKKKTPQPDTFYQKYAEEKSESPKHKEIPS